MLEISVALPDDLHDWAQAHIAESGYADISDLIRDLLRKERELRGGLEELRVLIRDASAPPEPREE